jgi:hypothetical protein
VPLELRAHLEHLLAGGAAQALDLAEHRIEGLLDGGTWASATSR